VLASIQANFCAVAAAGPECELFGEHGTLAFDLVDVAAPLKLYAGNEWTEQAVAHERAGGPDHILGIRHLAECVRSGSQPLLGPDRAIHVLEVLEAARASVREGRTIEVRAGDDPAMRHNDPVKETSP